MAIMEKDNYVCIVSRKAWRCVDTAKDLKSLTKRMESKNCPYPEDSVAISVVSRKILHSIETEELRDVTFIDTVLASALVAGVEIDKALDALEEKGIIKKHDINFAIN